MANITPEKKALAVNALMDLRAILLEPDEAKAKAAAEVLVDRIAAMDDDDGD